MFSTNELLMSVMGRRSRTGDNIWHPKFNKAFFFLFTPKNHTGGNSTWFHVTIRTTIIYGVPLGAKVFSIHNTFYNSSSIIRTILVASVRQPTHTSLCKSGIVWAHGTKRRTKFMLRITGRVSGNSLGTGSRNFLDHVSFFTSIFACWSCFLLL